MKGPLGVKIFGVLFILSSTLLLLSSILLIIVEPRVLQQGFAERVVQGFSEEERAALTPEYQKKLEDMEQQLADSPATLGSLGLIIAMLISLCNVISGIGLLRLKNWARWLTIVIMGISVVWLMIDVVARGTLIRAIYGLIFSGVVLWYFLRPSVKAQFQRSG